MSISHQIIKKISSLEPPAWLLLTLLLIFILRIPSLFEPFRYADENIYLTLGLAVKKGLILYRDIHDNKPPIIYLIAALAGNVFWFRFILLIVSLIATSFFYQLAKIFLDQKTRLIQFATVFFAITTSIPLFEGNIANSEIFIICPILIAFYLILSGKSWWRPLVAGVFFSLALLLKVPAIFDIVAIPIFWLLDLKINRPLTWKHWFTKNLLLLTGILFPLLISFIYYTAHQAFSSYLTIAFLQNFGYLSTWKSATPTSSFFIRNSALLLRAALALLATLSFFILNKKRLISSTTTLLLTWFSWTIFSVFLSERPYPHYIIQALPPLSLILAWLIQGKSPQKLFSLPLLALFIAGLVHFKFYYGPTYPYYANFIKLATGQLSQDQYIATFGNQYPSRYQLASFIAATTSKDDRIFVWGTDPEIYALSRRLPVGRYTVSYHIFDFNGQTETLTVLRSQMPKYIIITQTESRPWPELFQFITTRYSPLRTFGDAIIYWHPPESKIGLPQTK